MILLNIKFSIIGTVLLISLSSISCKKFVQIDPPRTDIDREIVFTTEEKAIAAVVDIYSQFHLSGFASGDINSVSYAAALSADDLETTLTFNPAFPELQNNNLTAPNTVILTLWSDAYKIIYRCNAVLEGLETSPISADVNKQLKAEALFARAFCYFYLVNLFGDVPLVLSTNYVTNSNIGRSKVAAVYAKVIEDLNVARDFLPVDFSAFNGDRIRPVQATANALLSRIYLYKENYTLAEQSATLVIENSQFELVEVSHTFLKNNKESILQVLPRFGSPFDQIVAQYGSTLRAGLLSIFSLEDSRYSAWIRGNLCNKYKSDGDYSENSVVIRLAEIYLIRAEARARQNQIAEGLEDLNVIRAKAGLSDLYIDNESDLLSAILLERRKEFFSEWGHRWLDLKRLNLGNSILAPLKEGWSESDLLYPIPQSQILSDPAMRDAQNPNY